MYDIFAKMSRQGPGARQFTQQALQSIPDLPAHPSILDLGCGTGGQSFDIASMTKGKITAVDLYSPFLDKLNTRAKELGFKERISTVHADMLELEFAEASFDLIWSEGAVYAIGLKSALNVWKPLLKHKGYIVVSEFNWLHPSPPKEILDYFMPEVPESVDIDGSMRIIKENGFHCIDHFILPEEPWELFYDELQAILDLEKVEVSTDGEKEVIAMLQDEINIYRKFKQYFGYTFFIMQGVV